MLTALRFVSRPLRMTASIPMIFTCSDKNDYFIKFHGLPGQAQMVINELVAYKLAKHLSLPTLEAEIINVPAALIENDPTLSKLGLKAGLHFGTKHKTSLAQAPLSGVIGLASNHHVIPGIIGFDHWINNGDRCGKDGNILIEKTTDGQYNIIIIDHGHAFSGPQWTPEQLLALSDFVQPLPVRGTAVYGQLATYVIGTAPFGKIIDDILSIEVKVILQIANEVPEEWGFSEPHKKALATFLEKRRTILQSSIYQLKDQFPGWKEEQAKWNL